MSLPRSETEPETFIARPHHKTVVVMPAYNASRTLAQTYNRIPPGSYDEIILVDDASSDNTWAVANSLPITAIRHRKNRGYGGNQKTCYTRALEHGAEFIVMLHPDYQYDPTIVGDLVVPLRSGEADVVLASRMLGDPLAGGMPLWKYVANKSLTGLENLALGTRFSEFHTGYRAFSRKALESVNFEANSEGFLFDNEIIVQLVLRGFRFKEIPVSTRYSFDCSSVGFGQGCIYGLGILKTITKYFVHRSRIYRFKQFL
ncbi:MAG: glycosyltransferase family 2 protein [Acidobacteria bacterium]|nr:glycosyltransferase family 2 protein [Acidobacteriota bacterium]